MLADLALFKLSNAPLLILSWMLLVGVFGVLTYANRRMLVGIEFWIATAFTAALVFSAFQIENLLWGWQVTILLLCFSAAAACLFLSLGKLRWAVISGLVCTGSVASGLWIWPVLVFQAWKMGEDKRTLGWLIGPGAAVWALYLWNYQSFILGMGYQTAAAKPLDALTLAALYLGGPFSLLSITVGLAIGWVFVYGAWAALKPASRIAAAHMGIVIWVTCSALTTAVARMKIEDILPPKAAPTLPSHYMTMALMGWASLTSLAFASKTTSKYLILGAAACLGFLLIPRQVSYANWWVDYFRENDRIGTALVEGRMNPADAPHLTARPEALPELVEYLRAHRLSVFSSKSGNIGSATMASNGTAMPTAGLNDPPTITSVAPRSISANQTGTFTVNGANFQIGFKASLLVEGNRFEVSPSAVTLVSPTLVRVVMFLGGSGPYPATLRITNPDGKSASIGFEVRAQRADVP